MSGPYRTPLPLSSYRNPHEPAPPSPNTHYSSFFASLLATPAPSLRSPSLTDTTTPSTDSSYLPTPPPQAAFGHHLPRSPSARAKAHAYAQQAPSNVYSPPRANLNGGKHRKRRSSTSLVASPVRGGGSRAQPNGLGAVLGGGGWVMRNLGELWKGGGGQEEKAREAREREAREREKKSMLNKRLPPPPRLFLPSHPTAPLSPPKTHYMSPRRAPSPPPVPPPKSPSLAPPAPLSALPSLPTPPSGKATHAAAAQRRAWHRAHALLRLEGRAPAPSDGKGGGGGWGFTSRGKEQKKKAFLELGPSSEPDQNEMEEPPRSAFSFSTWNSSIGSVPSRGVPSSSTTASSSKSKGKSKSTKENDPPTPVPPLPSPSTRARLCPFMPSPTRAPAVPLLHLKKAAPAPHPFADPSHALPPAPAPLNLKSKPSFPSLRIGVYSTTKQQLSPTWPAAPSHWTASSQTHTPPHTPPPIEISTPPLAPHPPPGILDSPSFASSRRAMNNHLFASPRRPTPAGLPVSPARTPLRNNGLLGGGDTMMSGGMQITPSRFFAASSDSPGGVAEQSTPERDADDSRSSCYSSPVGMALDGSPYSRRSAGRPGMDEEWGGQEFEYGQVMSPMGAGRGWLEDLYEEEEGEEGMDLGW